MGERVLATSDCERCRPGPVSQPANTLSSLAYVAAGVAMLRRTGDPPIDPAIDSAVDSAVETEGDADVGAVAGREVRATTPAARPSDRTSARALGWATIAVGVGSVAYHGPGGVVSRYAHDAGIIAMLGFVAWSDAEIVGGSRSRAGLAVVPMVAAVGAAPRLSPTAQALAGLAAIVGEGARLRREGRTADGGRAQPTPTAAAAAMAAGLAAQLLGRTGGPWCRPDSLLQPHAVWHVLTAAALWSRSGSPARGDVTVPVASAPRRAGTM